VNKREELVKIAEGVKNCKKCPLWKTANHPVAGEGDPNAKVMFVGEAPGYWEDQRGKPFVGQAGKLLDQLLDSINIKREEVFIGNILKHRPPNNRDPLPTEIEACKTWLDRQIEAISPKVIVTLGRFAMYKFIPNGKITKIHGQTRFVNWQGGKIIVFPTFHPAAALRSVDILEETRKDFKKIPQLLTIKKDSSIIERTDEKAAQPERGEEKGEQLVLEV
jgi:uracil-DNA glycosylase family 4